MALANGKLLWLRVYKPCTDWIVVGRGGSAHSVQEFIIGETDEQLGAIMLGWS